MDFKDPYCYPNTNVLINKLDIRDQDTLHKQEGQYVGLAMLELFNNPIKGSFDYKHLQEIHEYLFQDVYEWAGETRIVSMTKYYPELDDVKSFAYPEYIESYINGVFDELANENYLKKIKDVPKFAKRLAYYMSEVNAVHPFREGNGRTQREFFRCLALENGFVLDWSKVDEKELTKARAMSIDDPMYLGLLIEECLKKLR